MSCQSPNPRHVLRSRAEQVLKMAMCISLSAAYKRKPLASVATPIANPHEEEPTEQNGTDNADPLWTNSEQHQHYKTNEPINQTPQKIESRDRTLPT